MNMSLLLLIIATIIITTTISSIHAYPAAAAATTTKSFQLLPPSFPDSGRQHPVLEHEDSLLSKAETVYGRAHDFVASLTQPRPLIDTINEEDKYGNDGEHLRSLGRKVVVEGFEGLSNFLNAAVDAPFQAATAIGKTITTSLNRVGGKLVGLAYKTGE